MNAVEREPTGACTGNRIVGVFSDLAEGYRQQTEWNGLRLVIEPRHDRWQIFVYDTEECELLHAEVQPTADAAKCTRSGICCAAPVRPRHRSQAGSTCADVVLGAY
jgi:hypothetical protein